MGSIKAARYPGFTLPSGHEVPFDAPLIVSNDTLRSTDNARMLEGLITCGDVLIEYDPDPISEPDGPIIPPEASSIRRTNVEPPPAEIAPARVPEASTILTAQPVVYRDDESERVIEASAVQRAAPVLAEELDDSPPRPVEASAIQAAKPEPVDEVDDAPARPVEASAIHTALPQPEAEPEAPAMLEASAIHNATPEPEVKPDPEPDAEAAMAEDTPVEAPASDTTPAPVKTTRTKS